MKTIVFDAGPIISLTMNNLLWILEPLKKQFQGKFCITQVVKEELVDKPLTTKRFEFEALQVMHQIKSGIFDVFETPKSTFELLDLANQSFRAKGQWMKISHCGEMSSIALALQLNADAVVIDERTAKELIENPDSVRRIMHSKLHSHISVNVENLNKLKNILKPIKVIRSSELAYIAYKMKLLDIFLDGASRQRLIDSVLWGVKLDGCAISQDEINQVIKLES